MIRNIVITWRKCILYSCEKDQHLKQVLEVLQKITDVEASIGENMSKRREFILRHEDLAGENDSVDPDSKECPECADDSFESTDD
jgi:hypothetical protein